MLEVQAQLLDCGRVELLQALVRSDTSALLLLALEVLVASEDLGSGIAAARMQLALAVWGLLVNVLRGGQQASRLNAVRPLAGASEQRCSCSIHADMGINCSMPQCG